MTQEDRQQIDKKILELVNGCIRLKRDVEKLREGDDDNWWELSTLSASLDLCCIHLVSRRLTKSDDEPEIGSQDSVACIVGSLISSDWGNK